jgi:hypothetical protein
LGEGWIFLQDFGGLVFRDVFADNGSRADGFEFDFGFHFFERVEVLRLWAIRICSDFWRARAKSSSVLFSSLPRSTRQASEL